MKILKKTVLFCLSLGMNLEVPSSASYEFTYELLYRLVPYEPVSVRGAVAALRDASMVSVYQRGGVTYMSLTSVGRQLLQATFPAFRAAVGRRDRPWTVCVFTPPEFEAKKRKAAVSTSVFRTAREYLIARGFFPLERGVYVLPRSVSEEFTGALPSTLLNRLLVFETRKLMLGDEREIVRILFNMPKLLYSRSFIAKTLDTIGKKSAEKSRLHPQTRELFMSLIPKLMDFFSQDLNIPDVYFSHDIQLSDTKALLFRVSSEILPKL